MAGACPPWAWQALAMAGISSRGTNSPKGLSSGLGGLGLATGLAVVFLAGRPPAAFASGCAAAFAVGCAADLAVAFRAGRPLPAFASGCVCRVAGLVAVLSAARSAPVFLLRPAGDPAAVFPSAGLVAADPAGGAGSADSADLTDAGSTGSFLSAALSLGLVVSPLTLPWITPSILRTLWTGGTARLGNLRIAGKASRSQLDSHCN